MTQTIHPELADAAAEWWADQLRSTVTLDNGDPESSILGTVAREKTVDLSPEEIDAFENALASRLKDQEHLFTFSIGVDYNPDAILRDAAADAGIGADILTFPWKTTTSIQQQRFLVPTDDGGTEAAYTLDSYPPQVDVITGDFEAELITLDDRLTEENISVEEQIATALRTTELGDTSVCIREYDACDVTYHETTQKSYENLVKDEYTVHHLTYTLTGVTIFVTPFSDLHSSNGESNSYLNALLSNFQQGTQPADILSKVVHDELYSYFQEIDITSVSAERKTDVEPW